MTIVAESRTALVVSVERVALVARYGLYSVVAMLFLRYEEGRPTDIAALIAIALIHNIYVHVILRTRRYRLFYGWLNFAVYYVETLLIIWLAGPDESDAYVLCCALLIGYNAYTRSLRGTMAVAILCCVSYLALVLVDWQIGSADMSVGTLLIRLLTIFVCGCLVSAVGERFRQMQETVLAQMRALAASETTLRSFLDSAADFIVVYDDHHTVVDANRRVCEFLGLTREKVIGEPLSSIIFDDGTLQDRMMLTPEQDELHDEAILVSPSGQERAVDVLVRPSRRSGNDIQLYVAVARDVTETRELQQATQLANVQLQQLYGELRKIDQIKTGLLGNVAQSMRSPLSAVLGYIEMLIAAELGETTPEQRGALLNCRGIIERVFRSMDELLDLEHLDTRRFTHPETESRAPRAAGEIEAGGTSSTQSR